MRSGSASERRRHRSHRKHRAPTERRTGGNHCRPSMFETLQLLSLGVAVSVDTLLLLILLEPRNPRFTPTPVLVVTFGVWLWHIGIAALLFFLMSGESWAEPFQSLSLF